MSRVAIFPSFGYQMGFGPVGVLFYTALGGKVKNQTKRKEEWIGTVKLRQIPDCTLWAISSPLPSKEKPANCS